MAVHHARAMDVYQAGTQVALHFYEEGGTRVVVLPLADFVIKARRDVDGNRRFFPRGAPSPVTPPPSGRGKRGHLPPARLEAYRAARRDSEAGACTVAIAARRYGVEPNSLRSWLRKERAKERQEAQRE